MTTTCVESFGRFEGAIAIAQEQAAKGTGPIRGNDIKFTIAIHIAQGHGVGKTCRGECSLTCKGTIAGAQEHADVIGVLIGGYDIECSIAVHIAQCNRAWTSSRGESGLSFKGAIAITQKHADGAAGGDNGSKICGNDVE